MTAMKTDLLLVPMGAAYAQMRDAALAAEDSGFDGLWVWDHLRDPERGAAVGIFRPNFAVLREQFSKSVALHPQTLLATKYAGEPITDPFGFPIRLRTAVKLGFKNPKWITAMEVTNTYRGGYWEDRGFNWFSGI